MEKFVTINGLSEISGISVRGLRTLWRKRIIPAYSLGHRTLLFSPNKVAQALERFEVESAFDRKTKRSSSK